MIVSDYNQAELRGAAVIAQKVPESSITVNPTSKNS
jgi:hypothetical protein